MSCDIKWSCTHCTYLNYKSALRCTMCGHSKSPTLIGLLDSQLADIYQLGINSEDRSQSSSTLEKSRKWICSSCTYLNFEASGKCTQCQTSKYSALVDQIKALTIDTSDSLNLPNESSKNVSNCKDEHLQKDALVVGAGQISPCQNSPKEIVTTNEQSQLNPKWRCRACTYENWPRGTKCVMCGTPKGSLPMAANSQPARLATPPPPSENEASIKDKAKDLKTLAQTNDILKCATFQSNKDEKMTLICARDCETKNEINKSHSESEALCNALNQSTTPSISALAATNNATPAGASHSQLSPNRQSINVRQTEGAVALSNYETERLLRQFRRRLREADWSWLNACIGVVEGNYEPVHAYLTSGGDPMRQLSSSDLKFLNRPSAFDEGHTLVHLAIRFGREDLLATILSGIDGGGSGLKRVPAYVAPDLAADIRRHIASCIRQRKGSLSCHFLVETSTFSLPADIEDLPSCIQEQLFDELLDKEVQKQLEEVSPIVNWALEITDRLGSRLYALWNRTAGDCLLDSLLQAVWGIFDRDNVLRRALFDSLSESAQLFYPRWKEYERWQARLLNYYVSENQLLDEWSELVCLASQPGAALEQLHIFVLAHIFRRPIIVYGVKCVKSFRGEDLGYVRFEGVYIPFLWETSFCWKSPLALGYTRGHFSALVSMEPEAICNLGAGAILDNCDPQIVFLPLMTHDAKLLPIHFLTQSQMGCEEEVLRTWLEVCVTEGGILVAQQRLSKPYLSVAQMTQEWLNHYRRLAQMQCAPFARPISTQGYSSDGDSDEE